MGKLAGCGLAGGFVTLIEAVEACILDRLVESWGQFMDCVHNSEASYANC